MRMNIGGKYYNLDHAEYMQFVVSGKNEEGTLFDLRIVWDTKKVLKVAVWEDETRIKDMNVERVLFLSSALDMIPFPDLRVEYVGHTKDKNLFRVEGTLTGTGNRIEMPTVDLHFLMQWIRKGVVIWDTQAQFMAFANRYEIALTDEEWALVREVLPNPKSNPKGLTKSGKIRS